MTIKTPERLCTVFVFNFGHISHLFLVFLPLPWTSKCLLGLTLSIYKRWNNILLKLLTEIKNLSEIAAHKKRQWSKVAVPKKIFSSCRVLLLIERNSFCQSTAFLCFAKVTAANHTSMDTAYCYFKGTLVAMNLSVNVIISGGHLQWYSIFKGTVIFSKKHLQSSLFLKELS